MTPEETKQLERKLISLRRKNYRDFSIFREWYFAHYHKTENAAFHGELAKLLGNISHERNSRLAIAAPRGYAKSTIITLEYVIYCMCYMREHFIMIISSTAPQAAEFLAEIKHELESNARLQKDFPELCEMDVKPEPLRWTQHEIITKNNIKLSALGVGQNIRGRRHNEHRPSLIILDDIEGNDPVQSDDSRYKLKDWLEKAVLKAGSNKTNFIYTGTIHHYGSLLAQYTDKKESPGWQSRIYRSVIKWSEAAQEWQRWSAIYRSQSTYEGQTGKDGALAYFNANKEQMLDNTEVLWSQHKSYYDLMLMREDNEISFDSEMQNEPVNPRDCCFNVADFHYWDDTHKTASELIRTLKNPIFYMACDPSLGKDKNRGDYSAIIIGVKSYDDNTLYVIDSDISRRQPDDLINALLAHAKSWSVNFLGIESNLFQDVLVDTLEEKAGKQNIQMSIDRMENTGNKLTRVQLLQPFLKNGKIQLCRDQKTLIEQLKLFPKGQHDDGPDALEMLWHTSAQTPFLPSDIQFGHYEPEDDDSSMPSFREEVKALYDHAGHIDWTGLKRRY